MLNPSLTKHLKLVNLAVTEPLETCEPVRRPVRAAAKKAAERRRVWVEELQNQN